MFALSILQLKIFVTLVPSATISTKPYLEGQHQSQRAYLCILLLIVYRLQ